MRIYVLRCELLVRRPIAEVFEVFENPYNLIRITPRWLDLRVASKETIVMRKDVEIEYEFRWLGLPLRWSTIITEYQPPVHFVDEAVRSPYLLWRHRHDFRSTPDGTVVSDRVDYALPFGPLGRAANLLIVGNQLRKIFAHRQTALDSLLGGDSVRTQEPVIERA